MQKFKGFVDLQINGFMNIDFSDPALSKQNFTKACLEILKRGTVAFLPTIVTSPKSLYKTNLSLMEEAKNENENLKNAILGYHIEGPFLSDKQGFVGAHKPSLTSDVSFSLFDEMWEASSGNIKMFTIAPERKGALELTQKMSKLGIVVSAGHTACDDTILQEFIDAGGQTITHLGNGIGATPPKLFNMCWFALANDGILPMAITDGVHTTVPFIKTIIKAKGVDKFVFVSDASHLAGMPDGEYQASSLGAKSFIKDGSITNEQGTLAGSTKCILDCANWLTNNEILSVDDTIKAGVINPLKLINANIDNAKIRAKIENGIFVSV